MNDDRRSPSSARDVLDDDILAELRLWDNTPEARWSGRAPVRAGARAPVPAMDELMAMTGLGTAKELAITFFEKAEIDKLKASRERAKRAPGAAAAPGLKKTSLHCILSGNPGTGKTTTARKLGQIMHQIGCLASDKFVEVDATQLAEKGLTEFERKVAEAKGGVLFVDEVRARSSLALL